METLSSIAANYVAEYLIEEIDRGLDPDEIDGDVIKTALDAFNGGAAGD